MPDYIHTVRKLTGHIPLILNAAGGVVLNDRREVLLQERADGGWCVPGGYLEFGENFREAVVREMKEDAGLDVVIERSIGLFDDHYYMHYPNGDVVMNIAEGFLVRPVGGSFADAAAWETKQLKYFPIDQLPPIIFEQNIDMVLRVHDLLRAGAI